ncbi:hypothetical protein HPB51_018318 [Rhipicephalus microplus]|uniref:Uncharacterized protein n=1 Tax=Rhipicephalus microplus TaxID=6941 RepID=A0A9J6DB01_RHIMP|nr:hypothetical protein HPB51_018318 [Rhipicephalus microplus]
MVSAVITPGHLRRPDLLRFTLPECLRTIPESKRPALLRSRSKVNFLGGRRKHVSNGPRMSKGQKLTGKGCKLQPDADAIQGQFAIDSLYSSQDVVQQCRISHNASVVFGTDESLALNALAAGVVRTCFSIDSPTPYWNSPSRRSCSGAGSLRPVVFCIMHRCDRQVFQHGLTGRRE